MQDAEGRIVYAQFVEHVLAPSVRILDPCNKESIHVGVDMLVLIYLSCLG